VLECLALTGLDLHVWLGFALCPLVLIHVVVQWQWFITQFHKIRRIGVYRARINALLNTLLLVLMSAVLLSGVLASRQVTSLVGESFGRVRMWHEVHGWLNFALVVVVGLHLALNWDWMLAVFRRRRPERPALTEATRQSAGSNTRRQSVIMKLLGRGFAVFLATMLSAGFVYLAMAAMIRLPQNREEMQQTHLAAAPAVVPRSQLAPQPRPVALPHGIEQLMVTVGVVVFVVIIGRYVFRSRL
jgi:hypothetical protein